jgi:hypothetical protein
VRGLRAFCARVLGVFGRARQERELAEELEAHIQMHVDDCVRAGMTPEAARRDAVAKLGGVEATQELVRDRRRVPFLETALRDLRNSFAHNIRNIEKPLVAYVAALPNNERQSYQARFWPIVAAIDPVQPIDSLSDKSKLDEVFAKKPKAILWLGFLELVARLDAHRRAVKQLRIRESIGLRDRLMGMTAKELDSTSTFQISAWMASLALQKKIPEN